jgi:hypothetical protein
MNLDKTPLNMAHHFSKTESDPKPEKTEAEKAAADKKESEKDKSFVGSLDRIARRWRESAAQTGHPALGEGAKALEDEADLLEPSRVTKRNQKEKLEKQTAEAKVAVAKAEAVLADPTASREDHAQASKDLKAATAKASSDAG